MKIPKQKLKKIKIKTKQKIIMLIIIQTITIIKTQIIKILKRMIMIKNIYFLIKANKKFNKFQINYEDCEKLHKIFINFIKLILLFNIFHL